MPLLAPVPKIAMGVDNDPFLGISQVCWMCFQVRVHDSDVIHLVVVCKACVIHEDVRLYLGSQRCQPTRRRACTLLFSSPEIIRSRSFEVPKFRQKTVGRENKAIEAPYDYSDRSNKHQNQLTISEPLQDAVQLPTLLCSTIRS